MEEKKELKEWREYKRCLLPKTDPHIEVKKIPSKEYLKKNKLLLARWETNWDCGNKTEWWHCIKDDYYTTKNLKSRKRYEINKGKRHFDVKKIDNPYKYYKEIYQVYKEAYTSYPELYRPIIKEEDIKEKINRSINQDVIGAYDKEGNLKGVSIITVHNEWVDLSELRVFPSEERKQINAAIVDFICNYYINELGKKYIDDGARNISHITKFQEYLVEYFGFRYAYSSLNIVYNPLVKLVLTIARPFRKIIKILATKNRMVYNLESLLKQDDICRSFEKRSHDI